MKLGFAGLTHLGATHLIAAVKKGFDVVAFDPERNSVKDCDIVFVGQDIDQQSDYLKVDTLLTSVFESVTGNAAIVLMSQVPPGYCRHWGQDFKRDRFYYQANTLIMPCALERAMNPEQFIVGCADPKQDLPAVYWTYLNSFRCPVRLMTYESAEFSKLAINSMLGAQIATANMLKAGCDETGADWNVVREVMQTDKRIGATSYLSAVPIGGHLPRDIRRLQDMLPNNAFAQAIGPLC